MPRNVQYILIGLMAAVFVLSMLARRFPHIDWLQHFRFQRPYDPDRDRHLDDAWMESRRVEGQPLRPRPRKPLEEVRKEFRDFVGSFPQMPKEQRARAKRRSTVFAGVQFILFGLALPFAYHIFSMMMFFSSVSRTENVILFIVSAACVVAGIVAIWQGRKE